MDEDEDWEDDEDMEQNVQATAEPDQSLEQLGDEAEEEAFLPAGGEEQADHPPSSLVSAAAQSEQAEADPENIEDKK